MIQMAAALVLFAYIYFSSAPQVWMFVPLVVVFFGCHGLVSANTMAGITEFFPTNSATATALMGASGFAFGAFTGSMVGIYADGTPLPMVTTMMLCALLAPALRLLLQRGPTPEIQPEAQAGSSVSSSS